MLQGRLVRLTLIDLGIDSEMASNDDDKFTTIYYRIVLKLSP